MSKKICNVLDYGAVASNDRDGHGFHLLSRLARMVEGYFHLRLSNLGMMLIEQLCPSRRYGMSTWTDLSD